MIGEFPSFTFDEPVNQAVVGPRPLAFADKFVILSASLILWFITAIIGTVEFFVEGKHRGMRFGKSRY